MIVNAIFGRAVNGHGLLRVHGYVASASVYRTVVTERKRGTTGLTGAGGAIAGNGNAVTHTTAFAVAGTGSYVTFQIRHNKNTSHQI